MFNRGMFHLLRSNVLLEFLTSIFTFMLAGWIPSIWEFLWCAVCQDVWHIHRSIAGWFHFCNMYCILIHFILLWAFWLTLWWCNV
jgi:hypothetical protein